MAFDLLKTSAKSWYSSGMVDRLGGLLEMEVDFPETIVSRGFGMTELQVIYRLVEKWLN